MKNINKKLSFELSAQGIDSISEEIENTCKFYGMDSKATARYRISIEESLGKWLSAKNDKNAEITFEIGKRFLKPYFRISCEGDALNPYTADDDFGTAGRGMLLTIGLVPEYSYVGNKNVLTFGIKKKPANQILVLLGIIALSLLVGVVGKFVLPDNAIAFMSQGIITPIEDAFFRILSAIAGPMIFLSVAWGVYGIGDVYTLGKIGKKLMLGFLKVIFLFSVFACFFYPILGPSLANTSSGGSQFEKIFEMILEIFPSNIFSPFVDGNTLQIIFLAFIIGLSMIFLGQRTSSVARAVEQINHIINFLMSFISKLVPFFVFIVLVNMIWSGTLSAFSSVWKFALIFIGVAFFAHIGFLCYVALSCKQNPLFLLRSILPSYLIALSTASSAATFESNMNICNNKFSVNRELSSFGVPFGMVLFKPTTAIYYTLICFYFATQYSVNVSFGWIATAVIVCTVSAVATPPIPGGSAATYTILFLQLGIDSSALVLVIAIDMIFDFVLTSGDMYMLLLELVRVSEKTGMHSRKIKIKSR